MFNKITVRDFSKPIRARHSEFTGPYYFQPRQARESQGRVAGFYQASNRLAMDKAGSTFDLRLEDAADFHHSNATGFFCSAIDGKGEADPCGDVMTPIVARLSHGRGFIPGWTMGAGMCAALDMGDVRDEIEDAARAAFDFAESEAEKAREFDAAESRRIAQESATVGDLTCPECGSSNISVFVSGWVQDSEIGAADVESIIDQSCGISCGDCYTESDFPTL